MEKFMVKCTIGTLVNDPRGLAPVGWQIPNQEDWTKLADFLGGVSVAGGKMKSTSLWEEQDNGKSGNGTNESGFSGLPGGTRSANGSFIAMEYAGYMWSAEQPIIRLLRYDSTELLRDTPGAGEGHFVRCVKK
jgi:uncharacterized protein (TIGR02145 family)